MNMVHFTTQDQQLVRKSSKTLKPSNTEVVETEPATIQIEDYTDKRPNGKPVRPVSAHVMQRPGATQKPKRLLSAKPKNDENAYGE